jgi:hypothetical protein
MSPVSRTRKPKNNKKKAARQQDKGRPGWFDEAIPAALDGASVLMAANGPRELEQATAELLGAELAYRLEHEAGGLAFHEFAEAVASAATARIKKSAADQDDTWEAPLRLLHGLNALGTPTIEAAAKTGITRAAKWLRRVPAQAPEWLDQRVVATGEAWRLRDVYGHRVAVIAGFAYPKRTTSEVFLFDLDLSGIPAFAGAGVYDGVEQAADAWRKTAGDAELVRVEDSAELEDLAQFTYGERTVVGDESRNLMDNLFRARRRVQDLDVVVKLPQRQWLYEFNTATMADPFMKWHEDTYGSVPFLEAVDGLAEDWMEGHLPETWFGVSPGRVSVILGLMTDWVDEDQATIEAKLLLPKWIRWLGENSKLPEDLIGPMVALAEKGYVPE